MADNVTLPGTGVIVAADDVGSALHQRVKVEWGPDGTVNETDVATGKPLPVQVRTATGLIPYGEPTDAKNTATDTTSVAIIPLLKQISASVQAPTPIIAAGTAVIGQTYGAAGTFTAAYTRPADTTAYAANDCLSNSTSAPTAGGLTFTSAGRVSGGSGVITDMVVVSSNDPATLLQGELWIYDSAPTAVNDNAAFASSDADTLLLVGVIPFTMLSTVAGSGTTSYANVQNLSLGFTCVGTANLRALVKVKNAYTPASAEVLTFRLKIIQTN